LEFLRQNRSKKMPATEMGRFEKNGLMDDRLPFNPGTITQMKTTMDDELIQVKAKIAATEEKLTNAEIAATEANLTEAKRQRKEELVLSLTNLLARLYEKELLLLSAGEIYCNIGA
jgi:hypothetical protein